MSKEAHPYNAIRNKFEEQTSKCSESQIEVIVFGAKDVVLVWKDGRSEPHSARVTELEPVTLALPVIT